MSAYLFRNDLESFDHQYNLTSTLSVNNASLKKQHYNYKSFNFLTFPSTHDPGPSENRASMSSVNNKTTVVMITIYE